MAEWIAAVGTAGALGFLTYDRWRNRAFTRSEQARQIQLHQVEVHNPIGHDSVALTLRLKVENWSQGPIHNLSVALQVRPDSALLQAGDPPKTVRVLPSASATTYEIYPLVRGPLSSVEFAPEVSFTDQGGQRWRYDGDYILHKVRR